jgi:putative copper export protein
MVIRAVTLWIHVLSGVVWVGACASFLIAAAALGGEPDESRTFASRVAPRINRLCLPLAISIPITGIANLLFVEKARGPALPAEFLGIIAVKVTLLCIMAISLWVAWRAEAINRNGGLAADSTSGANLRELMTSYGLIVGLGAMALGLGLWLSGS